ncbi:MAG TPA: ketopantoate reductase family protein [Blastocatellia bacterium]|nr:ketopantoate reductase family protein [Blastocatellia bacterium]
MSIEKATRYIIFGAGAIGGAIGAMLARKGARVVCVARPAQAEALRRGLIIKQEGEQITARVEAVTDASRLSPEAGDTLVITTKSQATGEAVKELAAAYDGDSPIVCLQNGVSNEEVAARRFNNVYAGLVFFSAVQLEPALIALPRGRSIAIGRYPTGVDGRARGFCDDLNRAGFDAVASAHVMAMKWSKFVVNLNNATYAITGYWVEQGMADAEMRRLMYEVREEGLRVLDGEGVEVEPPPGEPSPIRIRELNEKLKQPHKSSGDESNLPEDRRTYASMWQDLVLGRKSGEADYLNGKIVELGKKLGIPTPYNSALLEIANRMFDEGLKPGIYTPSELHAVIKARG